MDWFGILIIAAIILFGTREYRLRARIHYVALSNLARGKAPPVRSSMPRLWTLITVGSTSMLLLSMLVVLMLIAIRKGGLVGVPLMFETAVLTPPLVWLILIFRRDLKAYRARRKMAEEGR